MQITAPSVQMEQLLRDSYTVFCRVAFPADSEIYEVVDSDLILLSVIYFRINIVSLFLTDKYMFCTANCYEGLNNASSRSLPSLRDYAVYLML